MCTAFAMPLIHFNGLTLDLYSLSVYPESRTHWQPTSESIAFYYNKALDIGIYRDLVFFHDDKLYCCSSDGSKIYFSPGKEVGEVMRAKRSTDTSRIAFGDLNGGLFIGDVKTGNNSYLGSVQEGPVYALFFLNNDTLLAGDAGGNLSVWNVNSIQLKMQVDVFYGNIWSITSSLNGKNIYAGDINGDLAIIDSGFNLVQSFGHHTDMITTLAVDPAGDCPEE